MPQKHLITEGFIENILSALSARVIPYQIRYSPIYRGYKTHYHSSCLCLKKYDLRDSYSSVTDAFIDYEELINDYYLAKGFLSAAGDLLGQIVKTAGLKQIPGHADKEQKLAQVCQSFIKELPPEAREEVDKQFARRKRAIEDSQEYYYLAGYEIMVKLLKRAGYTVSDKPLKKLYETIWSHNHIRLLFREEEAGEDQE